MPLKDWAQQVFEGETPNMTTLHRLRKNGRIAPLPQRVGRTWWVPREAQVLPEQSIATRPSNDRVSRIFKHG
ncbi:hypothetical protein GCM10023333_12730 [Ferrimonas pelagia]|uniref:DNA-binding protein n=2 Tax=Ferrimonas pelagia TaxID=1177826 RepID=A0ABP9EIV9_9GAMM